jgi:hypothetical protein
VKPALSEQQIQRTVIAHLRSRGVKDLFFFHPANGGYRRRAEAAIFAGLGVVAGTPDIVLLHGGRAYGLELKADGGKPTPVQSAAMTSMERAGTMVAHTQGLDAALVQLEAWGLLRGRAV